MISDTYKAYVAGFFDGEGCVSMQAYYQKGKYEKFPRIAMLVNITQNSREVLDNIQNVFGGRVGAHNPSNNCYRLNISGKQKMKFFLESILPYSIVKKEDILLGLMFIETLRDENLGCIPLDESVHELRRSIYNKLNRRSPVVPTRSDSCEQTLNMLEHPERAISRHRPYGKASETTKGHLEKDDGIVRAAWEHAESGRNDQTPEMGNNTDTVIR